MILPLPVPTPQKVSQEVMSDEEITYRIGEIERISAILTTLDSLSLAPYTTDALNLGAVLRTM
jgi:hypothetical protein